MSAWWNSLTGTNQFFFSAAAFFSVFFIWQLISALIGLGGDEAEVDTAADAAVEADGDVTYDDFESGADSDALDTQIAFKLLSVRSIITFFTLFTWASALYLQEGRALVSSMGLGVVWGLIGMFCIAWLFYGLAKLTDSGNRKLATCVGQTGAVYLDIPEGGEGEIRVLVSGVQSHIRARTADGAPLSQGAPVQVVRKLDSKTVEVKAV